MFTGHIQSGNWDTGVLNISGMPKDFVLSARNLIVMEEKEYHEIVSEMFKWKNAYEEDDIRTNGLCEKVQRLTAENQTFREEDGWKDIVHNQTNKIIKLEAENKVLRDAVLDALGTAKALWAGVRNHPASRYAKDVAYYEKVLKGEVTDGEEVKRPG